MIGKLDLECKSVSLSSSLLSSAVDSYHRVNSLYNGTINASSIMSTTAVASNGVFTYKNAMKEDDYHEFSKAMIKEISKHKAKDHWMMMERRELLPGVKTTITIWSFK